jgi:LPS sulfotransferase NodH
VNEQNCLPTGERTRAQLKAALAAHPVHDIAPAASSYAFGRVHRDRVALTGYRMELGKRVRSAALALKGRRGAERRFMVLSRPRSGSTLLVDLLRQVPGLRCDGEMLHFAVHQPARLLSALARTCVHEAYGCKVLSYQIFEVQKMRDPLAFLEAVMADGFHLVHLRRETFPQSLSLSKAQTVGLYTNWSEKQETHDKLPAEIRLDPAPFEHQLRWNAAMLDYEDALMSGVPHIRVQYEADLCTPEDQQRTVDRICDLVGHPTGVVKARTSRISNNRRATRVANQEELRARAADLGLLPPAPRGAQTKS